MKTRAAHHHQPLLPISGSRALVRAAMPVSLHEEGLATHPGRGAA
ncbi:MAG TPA: hypothetical protein VFY73_03100 [Ideonella sp.]|nr:hypothetical protein [Ideonella sp.]HEX5683001.1 hypothetical protein [Ideonella sp.]